MKLARTLFSVPSGVISLSDGYSKQASALLWGLTDPNAYSTALNDGFGNAVAISGNYAVVAAYVEDDAGGTSSGKVYIFNVSTGVKLWTLNNPNPYGSAASNYFGVSVAISGNNVIVGAHLSNTSSGTQSGTAYIFDATTGLLIKTLNNPNAYGTAVSDGFGISVAISGNYAVVGAYMEDDANATSSGKAYIFDVSTGSLLWTLNNPNTATTSSQFGTSVSISGTNIIVGAPYAEDASGIQSGTAYIFEATTGSLLWTLNNPNVYSTSYGDRFGYSVAISGGYAVVGAYQEDGAVGTSSGRAYVYDVLTGTLIWALEDPNSHGSSTNDYFGYSVSISGNYAVIGAYGETDANIYSTGTASGKVHLFNVVNGGLLKTYDNPNTYNTSNSDNFGKSVAIDGDRILVGTPGEEYSGTTDCGKAYIYNRNVL